MIQEISSLMSKMSDTSVRNLNLDSLIVGEEVDCVAYVMSVDLRMAKTEKGFAVFYLKDENANVVVARLFDVADYMNSGSTALAFEGKPIRFCAKVQEFGGSISLVINGAVGVTLYTGDFDYKRFIGTVSSDLAMAEQLYTKLFYGDQLPVALYQNFGIKFLAQGRIGAFARLLEITLGSVLSAAELPGVDLEKLAKVFFLVMKEYYSILITYETQGHLVRMLLYKNYAGVAAMCGDLSVFVIDTLQAMFEGKKPQSLYANIITEWLTSSLHMLNLVYGASTIPNGAKSRVFLTDFLGNQSGGVEVLKY